MRTTYYFAYGSNMDGVQMQHRCPDAELLSVGTIQGWRFRINRRGVATVVREDGSDVYGIVWRLSHGDEQRLDNYEGVERGLYHKSTVNVQLRTGRKISAFLYLANDNEPGGVARSGYLRSIVTAASDHNFPTSYLEELRTWHTTGE